MIFSRTLFKTVPVLAVMVFALPALSSFANEENGEEHAENLVRMSDTERRENGVEILRITPRSLAVEIDAPGEVSLDLYNTTQVTPRISAQVIKRHAKLGDTVNANAPLVTLSSVDMAAAQGELIVTAREWARVKKLGRNVVSDRRYVEAQVAAQQARAKVLAFGMTTRAVDKLVGMGDASRATGAFTLFARQEGTIMRDDFVVGEIVEPGKVLFEISDESKVWVNARLFTEDASGIVTGANATVSTSAGKQYPAKVLQLHHAIDETTRTLSARIEVNNLDDALHAGQFVSVAIETGKTAPVLAIPKSALTLMNGGQHVFVLNGDTLVPQEVLTGTVRGEWVEIKGGLQSGTQIATSEVFLLKSLILKSSIGDAH
jgi:membrane fusion protein, heavy metal efflux system